MRGEVCLYLKGLLKNRKLARSFSDAALGKLLALLTSKVHQRGGQVIKVDRFFPSSKTCHACRWKWDEMELSDRVFVCKHPACGYDQFAQDRDPNAALSLLFEALRLIGRLDQSVSGTGSDEDVNLAVDAGKDQQGTGPLEAPADEAATTNDAGERCAHPFSYMNRSRRSADCSFGQTC